MLKRLTDNTFKEEHDVTVGVEFGAYMIKVEDKVFRLQIWDTVGQESFRSITKIFYRGSHAVVLGFSFDDRNTFESLGSWLQEIRAQCSQDCQVYLVGNKSDIPPEERQVTKEQAIKFKNDEELNYYAETSAKTGDKIQ